MQLFYIFVAILMFGILVAIHEFGHFAVAKLCNVRVTEFSIGMGPLLWNFERGETKYSLRALPLGGYCMFDGDEEETRDERSLLSQGFFKQLWILLAGSGMNLLLGFLIMLGLYSSAVGFYTCVLTGLAPEVSSAVSLQAGDEIYRIDGERVYLFSDISLLLSMGDGESYDFVVIRDGEKVTFTDVPLVYQTYSAQDGSTYEGYGIYLGDIEEATVGRVVNTAWNSTLNFARMVKFGFEMLFSGEAGVEDVTGPIGIVDTISQVGTASATVWIALENIAYFTAMLSINLFVMNLLPIPALDGGRILFLVLNAGTMLVFKKKIPERYLNNVTIVGFVLLMGLGILITFKDVFVILQDLLPFLG
ncbi:M50 family metallopeptidase [Bengtsoniella intestinalis]|uniref:M50 family metallopeptidase n=1 Tax=Bengtsoniella intestinalis TaxID=3073143 RepID=UPI00391F5591